MKGIVIEDDGRELVRYRAPVRSGVDCLPEGRVHGGSLMALLAKGAIFDQLDVSQEAAGCSYSNNGSAVNMNYGFL